MKLNQIILLVILLIAAAFTQHKELVKSSETQKVLETEITRKVNMQYFLHLPEGYETGNQKYPLMLYLHGAGERGDDLGQLNGNGLPRLLNQEKIRFPFIALSPQCPSDDYWSSKTQLKSLNSLLDYIIENYHVDETRIYLTGLSMGGFGTFALSVNNPERFTAIAPICGGWDPAEAAKIKHLPVWVFHGAKDKVVPFKYSEDMVEALKKEGGDVKFTVYPEAQHDSWTETYFNPELYEWFLSHSKQKDGTVQTQKPALLDPETRDALLLNYLFHKNPYVVEQENAGEEFEFTMVMENPMSVPITIEKEWQFAKESTWQIEELNPAPATLKPGETSTTRYQASNRDRENPFPLPSLQVSLSTQNRTRQSSFLLPWDVDEYLRQNPASYKATYAECAPVVDGIIDDRAWQESNAIRGFICNTMTSLPAVNTIAHITYDSSFCYLGIKCYEPYMDQLCAKVNQTDGPVWTDDSIEFFLDTEYERKYYFQFVVNSKGIIYDAYKGDLTFSSDATIASYINDDYWSVEMAIPWEKIKIKSPEKGQKMGFLVGRNRIEKASEAANGIGQSLQYPATNGSFHRKEFFGNLEF